MYNRMGWGLEYLHDISFWWGVKPKINENMFLENEAPKLLLLVSKLATEN